MSGGRMKNSMQDKARLRWRIVLQDHHYHHHHQHHHHSHHNRNRHNHHSCLRSRQARHCGKICCLPKWSAARRFQCPDQVAHLPRWRPRSRPMQIRIAITRTRTGLTMYLWAAAVAILLDRAQMRISEEVICPRSRLDAQRWPGPGPGLQETGTLTANQLKGINGQMSGTSQCSLAIGESAQALKESINRGICTMLTLWGARGS